MRLFFLTIFIVFMAQSANAIVIRHDVKDEKYRATLSDFPALATFYVDGAHGTLIKPKWIITAAHATFCIGPKSNVIVNNQARVIKSLYIHSNYTPSKSHDIALVELEEPVVDIEPARIYQKEDELKKNIWFIGIGGTGIGTTGETVDNVANKGVLRKAQNTITTAEGSLIKFVFNHGEKALPLEGVSGSGDSGGPAYIKDEKGFRILGISSRPEGKFTHIGEYGITEVYSRVSFFKHWIQQIINGNQEQREEISDQKLDKLPAGLTESILPLVCDDISIKINKT